jgi:hypothetical protein
MSLNCGHQRACCSSLGDTWAWRTMVDWYWQGKTPHSSTRTLWQPYQQLCSSKVEELEKEKMNLALRSIIAHISKGSLTYRKILRHGTYGFTSSPKEGLLWVLIALKYPSPSAGFEAANLGSNTKHANHSTTEDDFRVASELCLKLDYDNDLPFAPVPFPLLHNFIVERSAVFCCSM